MADIQWIKLSVNMFDDEKIKLIRTMPEGDSIVIVWVQLLCLAGKINDGGMVYLGQNLAYSDEMLSTIFNQPLSTVRLALKTLLQFEMVDLDGKGRIDITNWEKHQNIEGMEKVREQNRIRKQLQREREQERRSLDYDVTSRDCHATEEKKNREEENREEKREVPHLNYQFLIDNYHDKCPKLRKIKKLDDNRKKTLKAWGDTEEIIEVFTRSGKSDFMAGKNDRKWVANFDWIIQPKNRLKILEGNYDNKQFAKRDEPQFLNLSGDDE